MTVSEAPRLPARADHDLRHTSRDVGGKLCGRELKPCGEGGDDRGRGLAHRSVSAGSMPTLLVATLIEAVGVAGLAGEGRRGRGGVHPEAGERAAVVGDIDVVIRRCPSRRHRSPTSSR